MPRGEPNQYGPPVRQRVDAAEVARLAARGCTNEEIATLVGCSADSLTARFQAALDAGRAGFRASLRSEQVEVAMRSQHAVAKTNMLIWLGKQYLGQSDQAQVHTTGEHTVAHAVVALSDDDLLRAIATTRRLESLPPVEIEALPPAPSGDTGGT